MSGAPLTPCPCAGKHSLMEKTQEADAAVATAVSFLSTDSEGGKAAAAPAEADASATAGDASGSETKWVEMPVEHVRWILVQRPEMHPTPSIED